MSTKTAVLQSEVLDSNDLLLLQDALRRFGESSARLQLKYELLLKETKMLSEQLEVERGKSEQEARLWALGHVAGALAHELRNPLGAMQIFTSLLRDELGDAPENTQELVRNIQESINSLERVLKNMLHFAQQKPLEMAPVSIRSVLEQVVHELKLSFPHMEWKFTIDEGATFIAAHEESLRQIFRNLLKNASEACDGNGTVAVHCKTTENSTVLQIHDTGPGIPETEWERVFEPFVSTKTQGTGLGLAIVKRLLLKQKASIVIRAFELGTCFELSFPRKPITSENASYISGCVSA